MSYRSFLFREIKNYYSGSLFYFKEVDIEWHENRYEIKILCSDFYSFAGEAKFLCTISSRLLPSFAKVEEILKRHFLDGLPPFLEFPLVVDRIKI